MTTMRDIVTLALKETGVIGLGQSPLPEDINDGFTVLSQMLALWQVKRWLVPGLTKVTAVSNASISNQIRPDKILAAYARQLNTGGLIVSYPLRPIWSYEDYARVTLKDLNTFPQYFFYDGAFPFGNVNIWPIPSNQFEIDLVVKLPIQQKTNIASGIITTAGSAYTVGAYAAVPLTGGSGAGATADITVTAGAIAIVTLFDPGTGYNINDVLSVAPANVGGTGSGFTYTITGTISTLDTELNLPDFYEEPIRYNLCVRLTAMYQYPPNPVQGVLAKLGLNAIKNANAQVPTLQIPLFRKTGFNIYAPDVWQ